MSNHFIVPKNIPSDLISEACLLKKYTPYFFYRSADKLLIFDYKFTNLWWVILFCRNIPPTGFPVHFLEVHIWSYSQSWRHCLTRVTTVRRPFEPYGRYRGTVYSWFIGGSWFLYSDAWWPFASETQSMKNGPIHVPPMNQGYIKSNHP